MPRREEERQPTVTASVSHELNQFLLREATRLTRKFKRKIERPDIVRALITSYYEKRAIGLLVDPDD